MTRTGSSIDLLKRILENLRSPDRLDTHPWVDSLTVRESTARDPALAGRSPGARLVVATGELFRQLMPSTPPQQGKRLDTRWGRFGILAANYFAPLLYGRMYPRTLRDAWRRIDPAILLFVYGKTADELNPAEKRPYELIGDEAAFPANSTISDWHRDGLQDLVDLFLSREKHLSLSSGSPSVIFDREAGTAPQQGGARNIHPNRSQSVRRWARIGILVAVVVALGVAGAKAWQVYGLAQSVRSDIQGLDQFDLTSLDAARTRASGACTEKNSRGYRRAAVLGVTLALARRHAHLDTGLRSRHWLCG